MVAGYPARKCWATVILSLHERDEIGLLSFLPPCVRHVTARGSERVLLRSDSISIDKNPVAIAPGSITNLHDDLNAMFTPFWQAEAQKETRRRHLEQIYISRFGADDYAEIKRIRAWLDTRPNKEEFLAYLTDKDPFDV